MFSRRTNWNFSPNGLSEALARSRSNGKPLVDLTVSNPTECGLTGNPDLLRALENPLALSYQPDPKGLLSARQAVAGYYADHGSRVDPEDVTLTASTTEAYAFLFRTLCDPGDEVLVPAPSYPLFDFLAEIEDVTLVRYPLFYDHGWQMDFAGLSRVISKRTRALIVVHPNNPTGHFAKEGELQELNRVCSAERIALISDEVFLDYPVEEKPSFSFAANDSVLTFTMSGLSKVAGLPQMKASWLTVSGPPAIKGPAKDRIEVIADTFLSVNTPVQHALPAYLEGRPQFQAALLARVRGNLAELDSQLSRQTLVRRLVVEGGWSVVLRVPVTQSEEELTISLLEGQGVYVHPGHFFEFPNQGNLVLSLIVEPGPFRDGIRKILSAF